MNRYIWVKPTTTVGAIKSSAQATGQYMFPVVEDDDTYLGLIFESDLQNCSDTDTVSAVFKSVSERAIFIFEHQPTNRAKQIIREKKLQFVPVVDFQRHYLGTIDEST